MNVKSLLLARLIAIVIPITLDANAQAVTCNGLPVTIVGTSGIDIIHGLEGDDIIYGLEGHDIMCGGLGDDIIIGDELFGTLNDTLTGGDDIIYGDSINGTSDSDTIYVGDDKIAEEAGGGTLGGDNIHGEDGDDRLFGGEDDIDIIIEGNDIIDTRDDTTTGYNDIIDGDNSINGETVTNGIDICASNLDNEINCEEDDLSNLVDFNHVNLINPGKSIDLIFDVDEGIGPVTITNITVTTPTGTVCEYHSVPTVLDIGGNLTITYPNDFGNVNCNTDEAGLYTVMLDTEIGDPIITTFNTTFNVLPESIIGAIGMIGASIAVFMLYARRHKS